MPINCKIQYFYMFIRIGVLMLAVAVMDSALANLKMGAVEFDNGVNLVPMLSFRSFYDDNLLLQNTELTSTFCYCNVCPTISSIG